MYDTILVPTDGSDGANRAVEHALDLAERYGAAVYALYVVDTRQYGQPTRERVEVVIEDLSEDAREMLDRLVDRADNRGVDLHPEVRQGVPYAEITDYAEELDADLVVMGFRGQSEADIGSVTERVVRALDRPVLTA